MISVEEEYSKYASFAKGGNGNEQLAFCPIHGEVPGTSTPSLSINLSTGQWFCFSRCGGGGLASFLSQMKVSPRLIEEKVNNVRINKAKRKVRVQAEFLPYALLGLFDYCPTELLDAGFDVDILQDHHIGYDNNKRRITFPVFNRYGDLMAVVGRREDTSWGKYLPYTAKELLSIGVEDIPEYIKGSTFWGEQLYWGNNLHTDRSKRVIIVEGFKAKMWVDQAGFPDVLAIMGNHVTDYHITELRNMGKTVVSLLDGNKAGYAGTVRMRHKLKGTNRVLACIYPEGTEQPDDILDYEVLADVINNPVSVSRYKKIMKARLDLTE